jgi:hypothetical protein
MNKTQIYAFTDEPDENGDYDGNYHEVIPIFKIYDNSNFIPTFACIKMKVFNDDMEEISTYIGESAKIEINEYINKQN